MIPMTLAEIARAVGGALLPRGPAGARRTAGRRRVTGVSTDTRTINPGDLFVALAAARDGHAFLPEAFRRGAVCALVRAGHPAAAAAARAGARLIAVSDPARALLALGVALRRRLAATVVAVTGSCGKTTTKEMIGAILSRRGPTVAAPRSFNNAIGVPLTLALATSRTRYLVAELGTNAPGEIGALARVVRPRVGVVTSIGTAHAARLGGPAGVLREKASLWRHLTRGGTAVFNADHVPPSAVARRWRGRRVSFGLDPRRPSAVGRHDDLRADGIVLSPHGSVFRAVWGDGRGGSVRVRLRLPGRHNVANALAALAAARALGVPPAAAARALARVSPPPGRLERFCARGVEVWNDAYNANPQSLAAALETFAFENGAPSRRRIAILGEMGELGRLSREAHRAAGRRVAESGATLFWGVGPAMRGAVAAARAAGMAPARVAWFPDARAAARAAARRVRPGDRVLVKGSRVMGMERVVEALRGRA